MQAKESLRVFVSYARSDAADFADELVKGLEVAGFEAFLDRHDIAAGEDWEARLGGLIQSADTVVFVITPAAVASERCAWEVRRAEALSKRVIPIVFRDVAEAATPETLRRLNYIYFTPGRSYSQSLGDLAMALRVDLDWIREHTRLGELARRWQERERSEVLLLRGPELEAAHLWFSTWRAPAPEPTDLHRAFINDSEAASGAAIRRERARQRGLLMGVGAAAVVFAGLAAAAASSAIDAREKERLTNEALAGREAALELAEAREYALSAALDESEALRETASESARAAIAAQLAERAERERADASRAEADRATAAVSEAEALNQRVYEGLRELRARVELPDLDAMSSERPFELARRAMAEAPSVETRLQAVDYLQRYLLTQRDPRMSAAPRLLLGEAYLQLAGLTGPAGAVEFECAPNQADQNYLEEALRQFEIAAHVFENPAAYRAAGCTAQALGRLPEAIVFYERARGLAPDDAVTRVFLARAIASRSQQ